MWEARRMRASTSAGDLRFHVVAGTHVVLLGFDVAPAARDTLLGIAVQRAVGDDDFEFLPNFLRFAGNDHEGGPWGTDRNPLRPSSGATTASRRASACATGPRSSRATPRR